MFLKKLHTKVHNYMDEIKDWEHFYNLSQVNAHSNLKQAL